MYTYKLKINKVQGSLNESVRRNGITLRIKSAKKLSKNTLFEKADSYLNENYGVNLLEGKVNVYTDVPSDPWGRQKKIRVGGNTKIKRVKVGDENRWDDETVAVNYQDENGNLRPGDEHFTITPNQERHMLKNHPDKYRYNEYRRSRELTDFDLEDDEYTGNKKKARGDRFNTMGLAVYFEKYNFFKNHFRDDEFRDPDEVNYLIEEMIKSKNFIYDGVLTAPLNGIGFYGGSNLSAAYKRYENGKMNDEQWSNIVLNTCSEYMNEDWSGHGLNPFNPAHCWKKVMEDGTIIIAYVTTLTDTESVSPSEFVDEVEYEGLNNLGATLYFAKIKVMDCKNESRVKNVLSDAHADVYPDLF